MNARIAHVGVAVADLDQAIAFYRDALGLEIGPVEVVEDQRVRVRSVTLGDAAIELLEATDADSPVGRFVARRGPGIHHVTLAVEDLDGVLARLARRGVRLIDESPRIGADGARIAFVHPASTGGVLLELTDRPAGPGAAPGPRAPGSPA